MPAHLIFITFSCANQSLIACTHTYTPTTTWWVPIRCVALSLTHVQSHGIYKRHLVKSFNARWAHAHTHLLVQFSYFKAETIFYLFVLFYLFYSSSVCIFVPAAFNSFHNNLLIQSAHVACAALHLRRYMYKTIWPHRATDVFSSRIFVITSKW